MNLDRRLMILHEGHRFVHDVALEDFTRPLIPYDGRPGRALNARCSTAFPATRCECGMYDLRWKRSSENP